jgi:hypothetical protein
MKKTLLHFVLFMAASVGLTAQDCDVTMSNLSGNAGYVWRSTGPNPGMTGIYWEVLTTNGTNSSYVVSDFECAIYLTQCDANGTAIGPDKFILKSYVVSGLTQFGTKSFSGKSVIFPSSGTNPFSSVPTGMYRAGIWINSNSAIPEPPDNPSNNLYLIRDDNYGSALGSIIYVTDALTGVNDIENTVKTVSLYPNPSNGQSTLSFKTEKSIDLNIALYSMTGQLIQTLESDKIAAGNHSYTLGGNDLADGVYFCRIASADGVITKKFTKQ